MIRIRKASLIKLEMPVVLLLTLILAACASMDGTDKKSYETLQSAVEAFNGAVKWEEYSTAAAFLPVGQKEQFWAIADRLKGKVRIVEFQVRELEQVDKKLSGVVTLSCQYWRTDMPTLQTVCLCQKWYYIEKEKTWKVQENGLGTLVRKATGQ
jgi:hypothetical protein